jgi:hypothetical protein
MSNVTNQDPLFQTSRPEELPFRPRPDASALKRLLEEWMRGDEKEQQETFETLRRLDEDRPEGYKLFP